MLIGSPPRGSSVRRLLGVFTSSGGAGGRGGSRPGCLPAWRAPRLLQPVDEDVEAGGEPLVAVVEPDVLAKGDQGWEAFGGERAEELVQLGPDRGVADALLVDGGARAADRKADGVVDDEEEGEAGSAVGEPGGLQRH